MLVEPDAGTMPSSGATNVRQPSRLRGIRRMKLEILRDLAAIHPLLERWHELADGVAFRQPEWLLSWWEHFRPDQSELFVGVLRDEEREIRALAPWYLDRPARTLRCLGDGVVSTDYCTILQDTRFSDEPVAMAFAEALLRDCTRPDEWNSLHFEAIDCHDPAMEAFAFTMRKLGSPPHRGHCANTWRIDLREGWEPFLQGLSRNTRKALRGRARALDQMEVRWVQGKHDFEAFFPVLVDLHQKRRRALRDPGCFSDPRFEAFLRTAAGRLQQRDQLQAFSIWFEGRPIAADIGFRARDRWLCYQSGMDPEAMNLEPGKLANVCILREAGRFGIHTIDFLRGDEPYKRQLRADPHPACDLHFMKPGLAGRLRHLALQAKAGAKAVRDGIILRARTYTTRCVSAWSVVSADFELAQLLSPLPIY